MKHKLITTWRFGWSGVALGALCLAGNAAAQNPRLFPTASPRASAAASASATATATGTTETTKSKSAKQTAAGAVSEKDRAFMRKAAKGGKMEVTLGKMAGEKAESEEVKSFGNRMVKDHSAASDELMAIAKKKGVRLSPRAPKDEWKSDKEYMDMMVKDHEKNLAEFQKEAKEGDDADLKSFAEKTAKTIEEHLQLAKETQGKLK